MRENFASKACELESGHSVIKHSSDTKYLNLTSYYLKC